MSWYSYLSDLFIEYEESSTVSFLLESFWILVPWIVVVLVLVLALLVYTRQQKM
jgi:hypothetical protein